MTPFSILDLSPIPKGGTAAVALGNTLELAQNADGLGYKRYWLAEHHNMPGIASAATSIAIGHVAGGTKNIRVGSGGIMLPNHSPLVIAEQFGTLASLYPDRIDLGLGRAPGTDMMTARALRRNMEESADQFPQDVQELQYLFAPEQAGQAIRAVPGAGLEVPIWLLGSSLFSAQLAAMLGLPFAFASHFAPELLRQALDIYRERFKPSAQLEQPYAMIAANVLAADTDAQARYHFTSQQQSFINLRRGKPTQVPPPLDDIDSYWSPAEKAMVEHSLAVAFIGSMDTIESGLKGLIDALQPDELMITAHIHDQTARLRSIELVAQVRDRLSATSPTGHVADGLASNTQ
jgi:luciferase family oxidoreductase group 1